MSSGFEHLCTVSMFGVLKCIGANDEGQCDTEGVGTHDHGFNINNGGYINLNDNSDFIEENKQREIGY